jgi:hypothetical protein
VAVARHCDACDRPLESGALYYRFALAVEGEQDVVDSTGGDAAEELEAALKELEQAEGDPAELEDQVHWERSGVLCPECRARLVRLVGGERSLVH